MCYEFERLEELRRQMKREEELKKQQRKTEAPARPVRPEKDVGQEEPVPV